MGASSLLTKFLRLCGFSSESFTQQPASAEAREVDATDRLSRYVTQDDHFRPNRPPADQLNFRAFLPSPKDPDELSIARTTDLEEGDVWALGERMITAVSGRPVIARGDLSFAAITELAIGGTRPLRVKLDEPPERHALIVGWASLDGVDARKQAAQLLRAAAQPTGRPQ
jgi:hypothetical protein